MHTAEKPGLIRRAIDMSFYGLRAKIIPLIIVMDVLVVGALSAILYHEERDSVLAALDGRLHAVAAGVERIVPGSYHAAIKTGGLAAETEFQTYQAVLTDFAAETGMTAIYLYMQDNSGIVTVAASDTASQRERGPAERLFERYDTAPAALSESFADGKERYLDYRDKYGHFRAVFMPRRTAGGQTYVIDVDMSQAFLDQELSQVLRDAVIVGLIGIAASLIVMIPFINYLVGPVSQLSDIASAAVQRDFAADPEEEALLQRLGKRRDEIGLVSSAISDMLGHLRRYLVDFAAATAERERVNGELSAAREIQMGMLPRSIPRLEEPNLLDLHATLEPAKAVGGDLFDYFLVNGNRLFFMVGDVSGKGMAAALFMTITRTKFRTHAAAGFASLADVMTRVNRELAEENPGDMFVTVFAGMLDLSSGKVEYCDGGHDAPLILRRHDGSCEWLKKKRGLLLGLYEQHPYHVDHFQLEPGDGLVLFTDGVTEAMTVEGEMFTAARLVQCVSECGDLTAAETVDRLYARVQEFAAEAEQSDDITILALRYRPAIAPRPKAA